METLIEFGRGPLFRFSVALALLGIARFAFLGAWGVWQIRRRAGDKRLALRQWIVQTFVVLNPVRWFRGSRWLYSMLSAAFHVGVILVPALLLGHVQLWRRGLGVGWPALPATLADVLTLVTAFTGLALVFGRAWSVASRRLGRPQDWLLPPLISAQFLSGWFLSHPGSNPFDFSWLTLAHVWLGDALLALTPFTKIAHCVLLPFSQLVSEMAWRLVPGSGRDVVKTLGKEGQPI
jgi:hypothetical protein